MVYGAWPVLASAGQLLATVFLNMVQGRWPAVYGIRYMAYGSGQWPVYCALASMVAGQRWPVASGQYGGWPALASMVGQWWPVLASGGQWWQVVASGGKWWQVMASGGQYGGPVASVLRAGG